MITSAEKKGLKKIDSVALVASFCVVTSLTNPTKNIQNVVNSEMFCVYPRALFSTKS